MMVHLVSPSSQGSDDNQHDLNDGNEFASNAGEAPRPKGGASLKPTTCASVPPPRSGLPFIPMQSKGLSGRYSKLIQQGFSATQNMEGPFRPAIQIEKS